MTIVKIAASAKSTLTPLAADAESHADDYKVRITKSSAIADCTAHAPRVNVKRASFLLGWCFRPNF